MNQNKVDKRKTSEKKWNRNIKNQLFKKKKNFNNQHGFQFCFITYICQRVLIRDTFWKQLNFIFLIKYYEKIKSFPFKIIIITGNIRS